jgi:hypothetical protein
LAASKYEKDVEGKIEESERLFNHLPAKLIQISYKKKKKKQLIFENYNHLRSTESISLNFVFPLPPLQERGAVTLHAVLFISPTKQNSLLRFGKPVITQFADCANDSRQIN